MPLLSTAGGASVRGFRPYSTEAVAAFIAATGGSVTVSGNYRYHAFAGSGTFEVTAAPAGKFIDILLVGGGGRGKNENGTGGGGGVVIKEGQTVSLGDYPITVGGIDANAYGDGADTSGFGFVALGGGGGAPSSSNPDIITGRPGGNGGGGGVRLGGVSGVDSPISYPGGAGLQPTSASGGFGNAGQPGVVYPIPGSPGEFGGRSGAGGGAGGGTSGRSGTPLSNLLYGGGVHSTPNSTTSYNSGYGGAISGGGDSPTAGIVIVRYLYQ
jgi:hypothetical protein